MAKPRTKKPPKRGHKLYTFLVRGIFDLQFSFTSDDVTRVPRQGTNAFTPTKKAMHKLEAALKDALGHNHAIDGLRAATGSRLLIAVADEAGTILHFNKSWGSHLIDAPRGRAKISGNKVQAIRRFVNRANAR